MINNRPIYGLMAFVLINSMLISGCIDIRDNNQINNPLSQNKYVAIQEEREDIGNIIAGNNPILPEAPAPQIFLYNQSMVKNFYNESGVYPPNYPAINQSLKLLLGTYYIDNSPARYKMDLFVSGVYDLPYKSESGITILGVKNNGTVQFLYGNDSIYLNPGDSWISPIISTKIETINGSYNERNYSYTIKYTTTLHIINKGVYNK